MLKEALKKALGVKPRFLILGGIVYFLALYLFKVLCDQFPLEKVLWIGLVTAVSFLLLRFLYFVCAHVVRYFHNVYVDSIWGDAIVDLKNAYSEIHYLQKFEFSDEEFMMAMSRLCDYLSNIFERKSKSKCSVTIMVPVCPRTDLSSFDFSFLCHDSRENFRDTEQYKTAQHSVVGNTSYSIIVKHILSGSSKLAYINNDILHSKDYENTGLDCLGMDQFPYRSELVYPIVPIKLKDNDAQMCGLICIECESANVFDESRYDVPLVAGVADEIYDIIKMRNKQSRHIRDYNEPSSNEKKQF